jgi:hypothetical protein
MYTTAEKTGSSASICKPVVQTLLLLRGIFGPEKGGGWKRAA